MHRRQESLIFWDAYRSMKRLTLMFALLSMISCIKNKESGVELVPGDRIPEFSVTMNDGTEVDRIFLSEGISCVVFFTTQCPDCRKTLPELQKFYDEYASGGVRFALISREEPYDSVSEYWSRNALTMPYSAQSDRKIYELFAKTRVPRVYFVKEGVIRKIFTDSPAPVYDNLVQALDEIKNSL